MSALSIFKGKNAKNKNIGRKVNPVNIAPLLVYFHFTYELLAFNSLNSFFSLVDADSIFQCLFTSIWSVIP